MIFILGETVVDILSEGVAIGVPWNVFETVVDISSAATVIASVEILTSTTVDILSAVQRVFDVVTSETVVDIFSTATVAPSPTVSSSTSVDITSAAIVGSPVAIVLAETLVDITSDVISIPVTSFVGTTTVDIGSAATVIPVGLINSNTSVDVTSEGAVTSFTPSGMTKSGNQTITATSTTEITGWTPDAGSTVESNALAPLGSKVSATVAFSMSVYNGGSGQVFSLYLYRNGVQVGPTVTKSVGFSSTDTLTGSQTLTVAPTDRFKLYVSRQFGIDHTVNAGANTYVRIT
ncbi:hypothetical protein ACS7JX_18840 [Rhodococcus erythropolis]